MGLLSRFAENNAQRERNNTPVNEVVQREDEFHSFEFDGEKYYVTVRDNVMIFDSNMILIHTMSESDVIMSDLPLIKKASEVIANRDVASVKLFVKRNGTYEKLSFHNQFDAEFIMKKLKRVAARPDETIEEIFIEDNGAIVMHHQVNHWQRRFGRNVFRRKNETDTVMRVANVEEAIDSVISDLINGTDEAKIDPEKIDKCIKLLEELKD